MILTLDTDCREMEPSDGNHNNKRYDYLSYNKRVINSSSTLAFLFIAGISLPLQTTSCTLRIRGGTDEDDKRYNDIPILTASKFMWDGLPCVDFQEKIMYLSRM